MNQNVKHLLIAVALSIPLSIIANLVTPLFQSSFIAIPVMIAVIAIVSFAIAYQDIRNWLARRSFISKTKRIKELQDELATFRRLRDDVGGNTNRFILLALSNIVFPFVVLVLSLYTSVQLPRIVFSTASSVGDFLSLATAPVVFIIVLYALYGTVQGWKKLNKISYFEEYEKRLRLQIERLSEIATLSQPVPFGHEAIPNASDKLPILSGDVGEFSQSADGHWSKSIACNPIHEAWKSALQAIPDASWIWIKDRPTDEEAQQGQAVWHRVNFSIARSPVKVATIKLMVDDIAKVYVNSSFVKEIRMTEGVIELDISPYVHEGKNIVKIEIKNNAFSGAIGFSNPTGIIYRIDAH